jgi:2-polyprenyl-3-methyl-5-hydroxy-6-metoxy-1,4-benzoquinol methylase
MDRYTIEENDLFRPAFELANQIARTAGDPVATNKVYEECDPKAYDFYCKLVNYSDEQEVVGKAIYSNENGLNVPKDAAIHDAGCGTGLIGKILFEHGFTNIHGSDASQNLVETVKKSGWYKDAQCIWMGTGSLPDNL